MHSKIIKYLIMGISTIITVNTVSKCKLSYEEMATIVLIVCSMYCLLEIYMPTIDEDKYV